MNRARIREISRICAIQPVSQEAIESAILRAIEELLTQEPSEGMTNSAVRAHKANRHSPYVFTYEDIYHAMSARRAKSLEDGA